MALPHLHYLEHLELAGPLEERSPETALLLGECYLRLGHFSQAEEAFVQALARAGGADPWTTLRAHVQLAEVLLRAQHFSQAALSASTAERMLVEHPDPGQRVRLLLVQADLARLQGDYVLAGDYIDEARELVSGIESQALSGRVVLAQAQLAWARGKLQPAVMLLHDAERLLAGAAVKHLHGEACLLCGAFVGECVSRGLLEADWPLEAPAARYLARAQELFAQSGSLRDLERVRQHFRLYGQRATDKVADETIARRAEEVSLAHLELDQRIDSLVPSMNALMAKVNPPDTGGEIAAQRASDPAALGNALEEVWSEVVTFRADLLSRLISLSRVNDRLVDAAHVVVVERNQLRSVLEGVRQLGSFTDRDQLTRKVVELAQTVVNADRVVLALVNRKGDLTEREQLGQAGGDAYSWRFLAEQARRTGEAVLSGGGHPSDAGAGLAGANVGAAKIGGTDNRPELGTSMAVPIRDSDRVRGVIYADRHGRGGVLSRRELGLLEVVASQVGALLERQRMNWALRVAARVRETTMEAISDGVIAIAIDSQIRSVNSAAAKMLMVPKREIEGRTIQSLPALREATAGLSDLAELDGRMIRLPGGEVMVGARLVRDDADQPAGTVLTFTGKRRAQRAAHKLGGARARYTFGDILGSDPVFAEQVRLGQAAARSDAGVLITGESGTGKEVIAQAIHNGSSRASGPFVGINCAAIPRDLLESELFGHEEGAFTGAKRGGQPGKFELAEGGTVLLDEIGDMPLEMQAKLLRVLQERRYRRVGGNAEHLLDARVVATTNQDLEDLVYENRFRSDLLFRLKVIHLHLPPLRERPEDIRRFVEFFLQRSAARLGKQLSRVAEPVMHGFTSYAWPGNVRELEYVIEGEVNLADPDRVELSELPSALRPKRRRRRQTLVGIPMPTASPPRIPSGRITLADVEQEAFVASLAEHGGNVPAVAQALGVSRGTVYNKLRKYDLDLSEFRSNGE